MPITKVSITRCSLFVCGGQCHINHSLKSKAWSFLRLKWILPIATSDPHPHVKVLRALTLALICLGGVALVLSSLSHDLGNFGQTPVGWGWAQVAEDPAEVAAKILMEKDDHPRRLLEDSSEIDLRVPTFLQSEYRVEVEEEGEALDLPRVVARVGALR